MQPEAFFKEFDVPEKSQPGFLTYASLLAKWQSAINLVGPKTVPDMWDRHFRDSAQLAQWLPQGKVCIADLGSGAGFPGMVLALLCPQADLHLIESDDRKAQFLRTVSRETGRAVVVHSRRAEGVLASMRPDIITARAFAPLDRILDLVSGAEAGAATLLLLKGRGAKEEMEIARERYDFVVESAASKTEPEGCVLRIAGVQRRGK